jgi:hypothetical protein
MRRCSATPYSRRSGCSKETRGARELIAAARDNILELTAGDPAMEIEIDTREDPNLLHGIRSTRELSGSAGEIFFGTRLA